MNARPPIITTERHIFDLSLYDSFEVDPAAYVDDHTLERCDPLDPNIAMWCVYGHIPLSGCDCIADCPSESAAHELVRQLQTERKVPCLSPI